MKLITGQCEICGWQTQQKDQNVIKRVVAFHKSIAHGIRGAFTTPEGKRRAAREGYYRRHSSSEEEVKRKMEAYDAKHGPLPHLDTNPEGADATIARAGDAVERRREYQKWYRQTHRRKAQPNGSDAVPARLDSCPICGSRFFVVKGSP